MAESGGEFGGGGSLIDVMPGGITDSGETPAERKKRIKAMMNAEGGDSGGVPGDAGGGLPGGDGGGDLGPAGFSWTKGEATPGSSSGLSAGSQSLSGGTGPSPGASPAYSGSGGGGVTIPGGIHTTFQFPTGSSDKGPATQKGGAYADTWNTPMSRPENAGMNNINMLAYLMSLRPRYVEPAYKNQLNPFTAGSMAAGQAPMSTNYLSRLTGGTR